MEQTPFWLRRAEVREVDRIAIEEFGVPGVVLMENAGRGAAEWLLQQLPDGAKVTILCGPGNNGGDGFVIARHLENRGITVRVWLFASQEPSGKGPAIQGLHPQLSHDAMVNARIFYTSSPSRLTYVAVDRPDRWWANLLAEDLRESAWIVDALFGTGLTRALEAPIDEVIALVNASGKAVLAIDIPTGLDCDSGQPLGPTIRARATVTFVAWKRGFLEAVAKPWLGEVVVVDIGAPKKLLDRFRQLRTIPEG